MRGGQEVEIPYEPVNYLEGRTARQLTAEERELWYASLDAIAKQRAKAARDALGLNEQQGLELGL